MLLPNPLKYSVSFDQKKLTPYGRKIVNSILEKMRVSHNLTNSGYLEEINKTFSWEHNI